jgi:predicted ATP-dependent serine protease
MKYVCRDCGREHPTTRVSCKDCGSHDIEVEETTTESAGAELPSHHTDAADFESSPDLKTDGSLDDTGEHRRPTVSKSNRRSTQRVTASRSAFYTIRAYLLAPFHVIWMYKQAILAFLVVFGGLFLLF